MNKTQAIDTAAALSYCPMLTAVARAARRPGAPGRPLTGAITLRNTASSRRYVDRISERLGDADAVVATESARWPRTKEAALAVIERAEYWASAAGAARLHDAGLIDLGALTSCVSDALDLP